MSNIDCTRKYFKNIMQRIAIIGEISIPIPRRKVKFLLIGLSTGSVAV
jgi:hypothetical protein